MRKKVEFSNKKVCFSLGCVLYYLGDNFIIFIYAKNRMSRHTRNHFERGTQMSHKYVYLFTEGNGSMRELLGGKGANLAEMTNIGLPVPQGFTITTEACTKYYDDGRTFGPRGCRSLW